MELQIQDLISSIKKEGIETANAEAERILAQARQQAAAIVAEATEQAEKIEAKSKNEIEILRESARANAEHAQRDAILSFKDAVQKEFEKLLTADIGKTVKDATLAKLISAALAEEDPANYAVEVAEVTEGLKSELAGKLKAGLEIRISNRADAGFRLAAKDGSGYFDCSDEQIAQMVMPFFSDLRI